MTVVVTPCHGANAFVQGLRKLFRRGIDAVKRAAQYQELETENVQKAMLRLQEGSRVTPAITAYYRTSTAPAFQDEAAAAFRHRVGGVLKDTLSSIEYDQSYHPISTNMSPVLS